MNAIFHKSVYRLIAQLSFILCSISLCSTQTFANIDINKQRYFESTPVGESESSYKYVSLGGGYSVAVSDEEVVYSMSKKGAKDDAAMESLHYRFLNKQPTRVEVLEKGSVTVNYLKGKRADWRFGVETYSKLSHPQIYPGVDAQYSFIDGNLEYDFVLKPGGRYQDIKVQIGGAVALKVDEAGDLFIETKGGIIRQKAPFTFQESEGRKVEVVSRYVVYTDNTFGFELGTYDKSRKVIIDPEIDFSFYWGGTGNEFVKTIKMSPENNGDIIVIGNTSAKVLIKPDGTTVPAIPLSTSIFSDAGLVSPDVSPGINDCDLTYYGKGETIDREDFDGFVAQFDTNGFLLQATYIGGCGNDGVRDLQVYKDGAGQSYIYIAGFTLSPDFPVTTTQTGGGNAEADGFVVKMKLSATGNTVVYSTLVGGDGKDGIRSMKLDAVGNAYIAGYTYSDTWSNGVSCQPRPSTGVFSYQCNHADAGEKDGFNTLKADAFLGRIDSAGALSYITYYGGKGDDFAADLDVYVNASGETEVMLAGTTASSNLPMVNSTPTFKSYQYGNGACSDVYPSIPGYPTEPCEDVFLAKFTQNGDDLLAATYFGGFFHDSVQDVEVDASYNVYITGTTQNAGSRMKTGSSVDSLNLPVEEEVYLNGRFPLYRDYLDRLGDGAGDTLSREVYVTKFTSDLSSLAFSTFVRGSDYDTVDAMLLRNGSIYLVGQTWSGDFPIEFGAQEQIVNPAISASAPYPCIRNTTTQVNINKPFKRYPVKGDAYIVQLKEDCAIELVYSTLLGGEGIDFLSSIELDAAGNIYVAGSTVSSLFPIRNPPYTSNLSINGTDFDSFITKINPGVQTTDISVGITSSAAQRVNRNNLVTFDVLVKNESSTDAVDVKLVLEFPLDDTEYSAPDGIDCKKYSGRLYCTLGNMIASASKSVTLKVRPPRTGFFRFRAAVDSMVADSNPADNLLDHTIRVVEPPSGLSLSPVVLFSMLLLITGLRFVKLRHAKKLS